MRARAEQFGRDKDPVWKNLTSQTVICHADVDVLPMDFLITMIHTCPHPTFKACMRVRTGMSYEYEEVNFTDFPNRGISGLDQAVEWCNEKLKEIQELVDKEEKGL